MNQNMHLSLHEKLGHGKGKSWCRWGTPKEDRLQTPSYMFLCVQEQCGGCWWKNGALMENHHLPHSGACTGASSTFCFPFSSCFWVDPLFLLQLTSKDKSMYETQSMANNRNKAMEHRRKRKTIEFILQCIAMPGVSIILKQSNTST